MLWSSVRVTTDGVAVLTGIENRRPGSGRDYICINLIYCITHLQITAIRKWKLEKHYRMSIIWLI